MIGRLDLAPMMRIADAYLAATSRQSAQVARAVRTLYRRMRRVAATDPIAIADLAIDGETPIAIDPWRIT